MSRTPRARLTLGGATAAALVGGLILTGTTTGPVEAAGKGSPDISSALDMVLSDARLDGAVVAAQVRDAATGEVLYTRNAGTRLVAASTTKLFSSAAAVGLLGSDHRFTTDVLASGDVVDGVLAGDLVLRGGGDPTTLAADYEALAAEVAASGIRTVSGDLVADDSYFDDVPYGLGWAWDDEPYYYNAATSALTVAPDTDYDSGTVIVRAAPGPNVGDPVVVGLTPSTGVLDIEVRATTGASGSADTLAIERVHASDTVLVTGSVPLRGSATSEWVTVADPTEYATDVFARALEDAGVAIEGERLEGATPDGARSVAAHESMTVGELLTPFLKLSNNLHAEALVKAVGAERAGAGTWQAGLAEMRTWLGGQGVDTAGMRLVDGSGLSRMAGIRADDLNDLLVGVGDEPWFDTWYAALPVAGESDRLVGGTLRSRMLKSAAAGNVHAKTGSLTGVSALSGYVSNRDGRELAFTIITNQNLVSVRPIEDAFAISLADWSASTKPTAAAPKAEPRRHEEAAERAHLECSWARAC
ncbi:MULTISPECIES: D-alanyl-D-alanine carboxypeptidase/D-alanyl-D-alanine endopeptidase [unclassified Agromyces]|uniref:D-alanyl-D-alanine carboxypeptidase/D-alanyl-D-alanine endopeptidase n=1 Tax=unclassified Agromyces TaxID=2639701 RepID=UPI0030152869